MKPIELSPNISNSIPAPMSHIKSLFTWKGRDITSMPEENFLSSKDYKHNLNTLSEFNVVSPTTILMTKELFSWLPEKTCVGEGYTNLKERFQDLSSQSFKKWLTIGPIIAISYLFFKAMEYNLNCLDSYDGFEDAMPECSIQLAALLNQPGRIAQLAVAGGAWAFTGWLINSLGDYGLRGVMTQKRLHNDLIAIYQNTIDCSKNDFWQAIENGDEQTAKEIHDKLHKLKTILPYLKEVMSAELNISNRSFNKLFNFINIFIEEVLDYYRSKAEINAINPQGLDKGKIGIQ